MLLLAMRIQSIQLLAQLLLLCPHRRLLGKLYRSLTMQVHLTQTTALSLEMAQT
jgi:hypothetical protein